MSLFLGLPREIRDQILEFLLLDREVPLPSIPHVRKWNTRRDSRDPTATKILHSSLPGADNILATLARVNRQLSLEVHDLLNHNQKRPERQAQAHLELDLLLEDQTTYHATWLRVLPYSGPTINTIYVQIRTFTDVRYGRDVPPQHRVSGNRNIDAAPYLATWRLGAVVNAFLCNGPSFISSTVSSKRVKPFIIETLVIDIQPIQPSSKDDPFGFAGTAVDHATSLVDFIKRDMDSMFAARSGGYHVPWGPLALSRIRKLVVKFQGSVVKQIDIATQAARFGIDLKHVSDF